MESQTKTQTIPIYEQNIEKLQPHSNYEITICKEIQTKDGRKVFIVYDDLTQKWYWPTNRLSNFLKSQLDRYEKHEKGNCYELDTYLVIETGDGKTFEKDGKTINYLDLYINDTELQSDNWMQERQNRALQESTVYTFVKAEMINTKFGPTYLLTDDKGYKRFANKRLNDFILRNFTDDKFQKLKLFHPNLIVETGKYRTFEKDGKQITYLPMEIRA